MRTAAGRLLSYQAPPPLTVNGLAWWFKGDGTYWQDAARTTPALLDTATVGAWDEHGNAQAHAIQTTLASRPILKTGANGINGHPVVQFDGAATSLNCGLSSASVPFTWFGVIKPTNFAANQALFGGVANAAAWVIDTTGKQLIVKAGVAVVASSTTALTAGVAAIIHVTYSAGGGWAFFVNGAATGAAGQSYHGFRRPIDNPAQAGLG